MRLGRLVAAGAAAVLVAGFGIAGAAPASALSFGCGAVNGFSESGNTGLTVVGGTYETGEVLTATWSSLTDAAATVGLEVPAGTVVDSRIGAGSVTYTFTADSAANWRTDLSSGTGTYAISCSAAPAAPDPLTPTADTPAPPPIPAWVQAYARDGKDATCEDGWNSSWQKWAKDVSGGWVCTRTIPSLG